MGTPALRSELATNSAYNWFAQRPATPVDENKIKTTQRQTKTFCGEGWPLGAFEGSFSPFRTRATGC